MSIEKSTVRADKESLLKIVRFLDIGAGNLNDMPASLDKLRTIFTSEEIASGMIKHEKMFTENDNRNKHTKKPMTYI